MLSTHKPLNFLGLRVMSSHMGWMIVVDGVHEKNCGHVPRTLATGTQRSSSSRRGMARACALTKKRKPRGTGLPHA